MYYTFGTSIEESNKLPSGDKLAVGYLTCDELSEVSETWALPLPTWKPAGAPTLISVPAWKSMTNIPSRSFGSWTRSIPR